ncbi:DNA cytosine methyltransferase [Thiocapsa sp.]|uniref:DNA cytosine methyltransferase n=1 Tax=Thiocapsa sp. TaxID=2024551 RepID=UPI002D152961|nr:DNA cytosine methyltransferase [Thiocapsa sp.]HSO84463.1 DNA cytosine methyltransferase [Thiocapsa sp.]
MSLVQPSGNRRRTVIDLFSGAGGMSYGFHVHPSFRIVAAIDRELGKPSSGKGRSGCNDTFRLNLNLAPMPVDLAHVEDTDIAAARRDILGGLDLDVLSACPPCTGFSRANPNNHLDDDERNSLVARTAQWVRILLPRVLVMENARELLKGNFAHHFGELRRQLEQMGYDVHASIHMLDRFGLPQRRERALVVATRLAVGAKGLEDLWQGYEVDRTATHVRRGIGHLPPVSAGERHPEDPFHVSPGYSHPEQHRLCTLRELALLQGFPEHYRFGGESLSNQYRHIGDAVPPLISHQLAHVLEWMFTGEKPELADCVLPGTSLHAEDIQPATIQPGRI